MADRKGMPKVTVFGASIAGLTAAHELAVRGFDVEVIEMATALAPDLKNRGRVKRSLALGGKVRTQYVLADPFSDPDSWEPSLPTATAEVPSSALGWAGKASTRQLPILIPFKRPEDELASESARLPADKAKMLKGIVDEIRACCAPRRSDAETRANRAWYCVEISGVQGSENPANSAEVAKLERLLAIWSKQVEDALKYELGAALENEARAHERGRAKGPVRESARTEARAAEMLHPATGINVLHRIDVKCEGGTRAAAADATEKQAEGVLARTGEEAEGCLGVQVRFGHVFPIAITFIDSRPMMPRLSSDGERSVEMIGRILDRVTENYTRSPWVIVHVDASVLHADADSMKRAEWGVRLIEDRLRGRARLVSTEPHRELVILRSVNVHPLTPPPESHFVVYVDVEQSLPTDIEFYASEKTLTPAGAEKVDALVAAYRVMTANHRWPRWFMWPFECHDPSDVTLAGAVQEWLRGEPLDPSQGGLNSEASTRRTQLHLLPTMLPGEHRPFAVAPYDRHLTNTLRRIFVGPSDAAVAAGERVVLDNLNPLFGRGDADWGGSAARQQGQAIDLRTPAAFFARLRDDPGSFAQLLLRLLRYATICPERREAELASLSFWEYLEGRDNLLRIPRYRYSDVFRSDLSLLCRIVTGMSADAGDARTCANVFLQVLTTSIRPTPKPYQAFNAPTTEAWLAPWQEYLKSLNVKFTHGKLTRLESARGEVVAHYQPLCEDGEADGQEVCSAADYYVVATGILTTRQLTWKLDGDVPAQLSEWVDADADDPPPAGRLKPLAGIQYFFVTDERARIEPAYFCVRDSGWSLTVVTSDKLWHYPPRVTCNGFNGMVSVDILAWDTPAGQGPLADRSAWQCTRRELAEEVWRRIEPHLRTRLPEGAPPLRPRWYHIDDNVVYKGSIRETGAGPSADAVDAGPIVRCDAMYAIPQKGEWSRRPGAPRPGRSATDVIHRHKLVFVGDYMQTCTRTATPEAANESARRAVNAILQDNLAKSQGAHLASSHGKHGKDTVFDEVWSTSGEGWHSAWISRPEIRSGA
ncbi:hypothetical protein [Sorangium sp. So ce693]|uniref:hypothetical protein n=1 Tax=Sorangium sp. So ce693 TaxID=3133318 RepID=UPI003F5DEE3C